MALEAVIEEVLKLSAEERTELVARLLDSLDDNADPGHEAAWTGVIDRRMKDIAEEPGRARRCSRCHGASARSGRRATLMPLPVRFHPDALLELKDGAAFYGDRS